MIINQSTNDVLRIGEESETKQATINADKMSKLQHMLTSGLYNDPISACMVEWANNAIDSIIQSGKDPIQNPSIVKLDSSNNVYSLTITDKGLGLNKDEFENVVMSYLTSTKEESSDTIGHFGIGCKAFLGLERPSEWTCRKDGIEYKFLAYKGVEFLEYDPIYEIPTTEENGVEIKMRINNYNEYNQFVNKAKAKLSYYDEITLIVNGNIVNNKIYRNNLFQWCDNIPYNEMHFTLKDVLYKINWTNLGISPINIPVCLRFHLTDGFTPTISREDIIYNEYTKKKILDKIKDVATFFVNKYNETSEYNTYLEVHPFIGNTNFHVTILSKMFNIDSLIQYSTVPKNSVSMKGVNHLNLSLVRNNMNEVFSEYESVAFDSRDNIWKKNHISRITSLKQIIFNKEYYGDAHKSKIIELNHDIVGNIKSYVREKYGSKTLYVIKNRKFSLKPGLLSHDESYYHLLNLRQVKKDQWRIYIKEFQLIIAQLTSIITKEFDIDINPKYVDWLNDKKTTQKSNRALGILSSTYKGLNKTKGDITIKLAREYKYGNKISWDRMVLPISDLYKTDKLVVYCSNISDFPTNIYDYYKAFPNTNFVILNPTEVKHVISHHQYKTFKQFMDTKPFSRYGTALYAKQVLALCPDSTGIIQNTFPNFVVLENKIKAYYNSHYISVSSTMEQAIINELKESGKWDTNIYSEIEEYRKIMSTFGFMNYLKPDNYRTSDEEKKVIQNMMYVMLKHNKVAGKNIEDMELVPKNSICVEGINDNVDVIITAELDTVEF